MKFVLNVTHFAESVNPFQRKGNVFVIGNRSSRVERRVFVKTRGGGCSAGRTCLTGRHTGSEVAFAMRLTIRTAAVIEAQTRVLSDNRHEFLLRAWIWYVVQDVYHVRVNGFSYRFCVDDIAAKASAEQNRDGRCC